MNRFPLVAALLLTACAASPNSRNYPGRAVDEPLLMPIGVRASQAMVVATHSAEDGKTDGQLIDLGIASRIGNGDRWECTGLFALPVPIGLSYRLNADRDATWALSLSQLWVGRRYDFTRRDDVLTVNWTPLLGLAHRRRLDGSRALLVSAQAGAALVEAVDPEPGEQDEPSRFANFNLLLLQQWNDSFAVEHSLGLAALRGYYPVGLSDRRDLAWDPAFRDWIWQLGLAGRKRLRANLELRLGVAVRSDRWDPQLLASDFALGLRRIW